MEENPLIFLKRLAAFSIGPVVSALIGFITVPVTTWLIAPAEYGKASMYILAYGLTALFLFLGTDQAYIREYNAEKEKGNLFWNALIIPLCLSLILGTAYTFFYKEISSILFENTERNMILILSLSLPVSVINRFTQIIIRMQEKAKLFSLIIILDRVISLISLVLFLLIYERSFRSIVYSQFTGIILTSIILIIITNNFWRIKITISKEYIKKLLRYGLPLIPNSLLIWLFNATDKMAIRNWSDFHEIGLYSAAFKITAVVSLIQISFTTFWSPTAYRWYENGVDYKKFYHVSIYLCSFLTIAFGIIVIFKDMIIILLSPDYFDAAVLVPFLLFGPIMYTISETTVIGINFNRKTKYHMLISGISASINLIGNMLLVPRWGALGASISTGISYIIFFWLRTYFSRILWYKFPLHKFLINTFLMLVLATSSVLFNNILLEITILLLIFVYNIDLFTYGIQLIRNNKPVWTANG